MENRPAWKQPQSLVLIAGGGVLALATLYLMVSTWGAPAPTTVPLPPRATVDENALVAANAEPKGGTAAANATPNSVTAPPPTTQAASESKPATERFNPNEIVADAQRALDGAQEQVDQAQEQVEDELDKPEPDGPK